MLQEKIIMRILGLDPGIAIVGYGIIDKLKANSLLAINYGSIETVSDLPTQDRLKQIYQRVQELISTYRPDVLAIEKLFFNRNVTTAFTVGQARGVMILAASQAELPITEYTPLQVKMAVTGYGKAEKKQVQSMTKILLKLPSVPKPDDVADALAVAICEAHTSRMSKRYV